MKKIVYSVVVPCHNEEETVDAFYEAVIPVMEQTKEGFEIIFINDGSKDKTEERLHAIAAKDDRVRVVSFAKNFGQQEGLYCGFKLAQGDAVIDIDVDLQDPVESILDMIAKWKEGYEVVHGRRLCRKGETFFKKITSTIYMSFMKHITGMEVPQNVGDFKLFDRKVIDVIISMPERNRFLRGITAWVGFKQTFVDFERKERTAGTTNYTFKKLLKLASNGVIAYSDYPLTLPLKVGVLGGVLSMITYLVFVILAICGVNVGVVPYLFPTITLLMSMSFVFTGLSNLYVSRIYDEVKGRPHYIVSSTVNVEDESKIR